MSVIVTQAADCAPLIGALEARGVDVWHVPTMESVPPEDETPLKAAVGDWLEYDWVAFTSRRAVAPVARVLGSRRSLTGPRIAAVGPGTAEEAQRWGWTADVVAPERTGRNLADTMRAAGPLEGVRVFFPKSEIARDSLPARLRELGAEVTEVVVYGIVPAPFNAVAVREALRAVRVRGLTFTSPSAARFFTDGVGGDVWEALGEHIVVGAIGPTTERELRRFGARRVVMPDRPGTEELAELMADELREAYR